MTLVEELTVAFSLPAPDDARSIRVRAKVTAQRLADEIGITRSLLVRWENGTRRPQGDAMLRYAHLLDQMQRIVGAAS